MSDFYKNPENLRLLQKVQLKEQSGMSIKKDIIHLMSHAFESMTEEDWVKYQETDNQVQMLYMHYCPELSPLPLIAIEQLVKAMSNLLADLASKNMMILSESLLIQRIAILIDQYNALIKLYNPGEQQISTVCQKCLNNKPNSFQQWLRQYQDYCQQYLMDAQPEYLAYIAYYYVQGQAFISK